MWYAQVVVVDVDEGVLEGSYMSVKNVKMSSMTNLLVGDYQVAVVDADGGPEGGKSLDFFKKPTSLDLKVEKSLAFFKKP